MDLAQAGSLVVALDHLGDQLLDLGVSLDLDVPGLERLAVGAGGALLGQLVELCAVDLDDDPFVIAGNSSLGDELAALPTPPDVVVAPIGGGGLTAGLVQATQRLGARMAVIGAEPAMANDAARSLRTRSLVHIDIPQTIADGARTQSLGAITFPLVLRHVHDIVTVTDAELVEAMRFIWERMKLVVEPTGALAAAAVMKGALDVRNKRVGIILSGGNVDLKAAAALFA